MTRNERLVEDLSTDFTKVQGLEPRDRALLDYAARLVKKPWSMSFDDIDRLRQNGFADRAILEANVVVGYMSFVNRLAQGLGVELEGCIGEFRR